MRRDVRREGLHVGIGRSEFFDRIGFAAESWGAEFERWPEIDLRTGERRGIWSLGIPWRGERIPRGAA